MFVSTSSTHHFPDAHEKLQDEHRKLQIEYFTQKEQMDDLNEKMKFFTKVGHLLHLHKPNVR